MKLGPLINKTLIMLAMLSWAAASGTAATFTWTPTTAGTYNWDNSGSQNNWTSGFPNAVGDVANLNINITGNQTINLNQAITIGTLNLGDTTGTRNWTQIAAGTAGNLTFQASSGNATLARTTGASASDAILASVILNSTLNITGTASFSMNGTISGSGGLNKTGASTLTLTGTNSYSGNTTLTGGQILANSHASLGADSSVLIVDGGTYRTNAANLTTNRTVILGSGNGTVSNASTLEVESGLSITNNIAVNAGGAYDRLFTNGNAYNVYSNRFGGGLNSALTLLDGTAGGARTLNTAWRVRNTSEGDVTKPAPRPPCPSAFTT